MTLILKSVYIDKLDDIVNKCNSAYYRTIKMKPIELKDNTYFDFIVLGYRIDLYFQNDNLGREIDKNGNSDRNTDYEIKRKKQ